MKSFLRFLIFLFSLTAFSQVDREVLERKIYEESQNSNFDSITKALGYKGGDKVLVYTIFAINKDGKIVDIKAKGPHSVFEKEAIRILENTPEIVPKNYKAPEVNPRFSLPITFVIETEKQKARRLKNEKRKYGEKN